MMVNLVGVLEITIKKERDVHQASSRRGMTQSVEGTVSTLESPVDVREIQPVHPKGDQS